MRPTLELFYGHVTTRVIGDYGARAWLATLLNVPNPDKYPPYVPFYNSIEDSFLTGHLHWVEAQLRMFGVPYVVHNRFHFPSTPVDPPDTILATPEQPNFRLKWYQCSTARKMVYGIRGGVQLATGAGKTASYIASLKFLEWIYGRPIRSLTLVTVNNLAKQMCGRMKSAGLDAAIFNGGAGMGSSHVVAVVNGVYDRIQRQDSEIHELLSTRDVYCLDEGHHGQAEMCYVVGVSCPAPFRWCLSATLYANSANPYQHPGDMRIMGVTGPTLTILPAKFLWENKIIPEPEITFIPMYWPKAYRDYGYYIGGKFQDTSKWRGRNDESSIENDLIVNNDFRNEYIRRLVYWTLRQEPETAKFVILIQRLEHGKILQRMLHRVGINSVCNYGGSKVVTMDRGGDQREWLDHNDQTLVDFDLGTYRVLIGSQKFDEGQSFPLFTDLILAQAGKGGEANRRVYQRVGRGMHSGVKVRIRDFMDATHHTPLRQAQTRMGALEREGYPVRVDTPAECQWGIPGIS